MSMSFWPANDILEYYFTCLAYLTLNTRRNLSYYKVCSEDQEENTFPWESHSCFGSRLSHQAYISAHFVPSPAILVNRFQLMNIF